MAKKRTRREQPASPPPPPAASAPVARRLALADKPTDDMWQALLHRDANALRDALTRGADPNQQFPVSLAQSEHITQYSECSLHLTQPIHYALSTDFAEGVALLAQHANINTRVSTHDREYPQTLFGHGSKLRIDPPIIRPAIPSLGRKAGERLPETTVRNVEIDTAYAVINEAAGANNYNLMRHVLAADRTLHQEREVDQQRNGNAAEYIRRCIEFDADNALRACVENDPPIRVPYDAYMRAAQEGKQKALTVMMAQPEADAWRNSLLVHANSSPTRAIIMNTRSVISRPVPTGDGPAAAAEASEVAPATPGTARSWTRGRVAPAEQPPVPMARLFEAFRDHRETPRDRTPDELHAIFYAMADGTLPPKGHGPIPGKIPDDITTAEWIALSRAFADTVQQHAGHPGIKLRRDDDAPASGAGAPGR